MVDGSSRELMAEMVAYGAFPGAVLMVSKCQEIVVEEAVGQLTYERGSCSTTIATVYELASVTKVFVSILVLRLIADDRFALDTQIGDLLCGISGDLGHVPVRDLLGHTSGLPSLPDLNTEYDNPTQLRAAIERVSLQSRPGLHVCYSSLNYMFLAWIVERTTSERLEDCLQRLIFEPLGLNELTFWPHRGQLDRVAPTEYSRRRGRVLCGEVHDETASLFPTPSGHTGLFASAPALLRFAEALLPGRSGILPSHLATMLFSAITPAPEVTRSAAFVINDPEFGLWPKQTFSHTGFTGSSLLLVPSLDIAAVLLSNRVYPTRRNERIAHARRVLHQWIADTLVDVG